MKKVSKISIIVPFYNSAKTIIRCIDSILAQNYDCYEILAIDDGSIDDGVKILKSYNDNRIKILRQKHKGVSAARNLGIKKSSGDYIMFLDSDDTLEKDALMKLVEKVLGNDNFGIIKFGYNTIKNDRKTRKSMYELTEKILDSSNARDYELMVDNFFRNDDTIPCFSVTLFLSRGFLMKNKLRFDESKCMMEDAIFHLDMIKKGVRIYFYNEALYNVHEDNDSVTRSDSNAIKVAEGAFESAKEILAKIGYDGKSCFKYFRIVIGCTMKCVRNMNEIKDLCFCSEMKKIAKIAKVSKNKAFWGLARMAILHNDKMLLLCLSRVYDIRRRIRK